MDKTQLKKRKKQHPLPKSNSEIRFVKRLKKLFVSSKNLALIPYTDHKKHDKIAYGSGIRRKSSDYQNPNWDSLIEQDEGIRFLLQNLHNLKDYSQSTVHSKILFLVMICSLLLLKRALKIRDSQPHLVF